VQLITTKSTQHKYSIIKLLPEAQPAAFPLTLNVGHGPNFYYRQSSVVVVFSAACIWSYLLEVCPAARARTIT